MRCAVDKDRDKQKTEYEFDQLLRGSLGCSDDQLLEKMKFAEETVDDSQIPPEPEDGFERLMAEVNGRGITPHLMSDRKTEADEKNADRPAEERRRIRCLGPLIRVALAVGILGSVLVFTSIQAGAKRSYKYSKNERYNQRNDVAMNNEQNNRAVGNLTDAYQEIHSQMGINVLMLGERPPELIYEKTAVSNRHATMYFNYKGSSFYVIQQLKTVDDSANIISDRMQSSAIYNEWIEKDITIEKAVTENGEVEYSAQIIEGNAFYYISGIMEEDEFIKIIEKVRFME